MTSTIRRQPPFHLAFQVDDLEAARRFYRDILGCREGRSDARWVDFDFYGHQIVAHLGTSHGRIMDHTPVDGRQVPVPHFGVVLEWQSWEHLAEKLRDCGVEFEIEPCVRFAGQPGEQATMFFYDPAGNAIEIKAFRSPENLFAV